MGLQYQIKDTLNPWKFREEDICTVSQAITNGGKYLLLSQQSLLIWAAMWRRLPQVGTDQLPLLR